MSDFKKKAITTYQIMTYVFLSFKVGIFSAIIMPSFKLGFQVRSNIIFDIQILFALIYYTGLFPLAYLGYKHTVIDLTDPIVKLERRAKIEKYKD